MRNHVSSAGVCRDSINKGWRREVLTTHPKPWPLLTIPVDVFPLQMYFVFALIWAFGGALCEKDGINYRRNFDKWFKNTWTSVKIPGKVGTASAVEAAQR